ncbi:MAG TPA: hypothetical protein VGK63_06145 [Candidatus Limnocylindrales bacterium]
MTDRPSEHPPIPLVALALGAGLVIGSIDASATLNTGGLVVVALVAVAAALAHAGRHRPWLWASLLGVPTAIVELPRSGFPAVVLILGLVGLGAAMGWTLGAARRRPGSARRRPGSV